MSMNDKQKVAGWDRCIAPLAAFAAMSAFADVSLNGIFSDHMVLQREREVPVWGKADPGETVSVSFGGRQLRATADAKGRWEVKFPAMKWNATAQELSAKGAKNEVVVKDVLVGDVWLVSGQSNSEMSFGWGIINGEEEKAKAKDFPNIRAVKFEHRTSVFPIDDAPCCRKWQVATKDTLNGITAEGYFMVRELNEKTGIPMGILDDNWSGCRIEPFVNDVGLESVPQLKGHADRLKAHRANVAAWAERVVAAKTTGDYSAVGSFPEDSDWTRQYNAMIAPIVKFPIAGATWYQGCSNCGEGIEYAHKLVALAGGWRAAWGYEFPFYVVQLASFTDKTTDPAGGNGYARIRNAERIAAQTMIQKSGLAVAIDIGNAKDIHPKNKYDVGHRLALWARRDVYGEKDLVPSGPLYKEMKVDGSKARISFEYADSGLMAAEKGPDTPGVAPVSSPDGVLKGFAVAGADRKWFWAKAEISGSDVVVYADEVKEPVAVRYAHRANPMGDCNLYNKEGLPASPFRTDNW